MAEPKDAWTDEDERQWKEQGVYVCNTQAQPYGNIKPFAAIVEDLTALIP